MNRSAEQTAPLSPFTEPGFRRLAAARLLQVPPPAFTDTAHRVPHGASDYDLNPDLSHLIATEPPPKPAAVLVPIIARAPLTVLLTVRTEHLPSHAGQISFPGGKVDAADTTPVATALREAHEEIGLQPGAVEVLGALAPTSTIVTGYAVYPFVGLIDPGRAWTPSEAEVAEVLELGLDEVAAGYGRRRLVRRGVPIRTDTYEVAGQLIWGATARMVADLLARLDAA